MFRKKFLIVERFLPETLQSRLRLRLQKERYVKIVKMNVRAKWQFFFSTRVKVGAEGGSELARNLRNLLNKNSSALRIECMEKNGAQVFYIRDRNIFDYIWEELDAHESELVRMRSNARAVLELKIRPFIQGEKIWDGSGVALWKKIEERILDNDAPDKRTSNPHSLHNVALMYVKASDQLLSVPDGLSVCNVYPNKFIATKILPVKNITFNQNNIPRNTGKIMACEEWPIVAKDKEIRSRDVKEFYLNAFRNSCANIKTNYFSFVVEPILHPLDEDNQLSRNHVVGLVKAVKEFIKENKESKKTVSVVIATENSSWYVALRDKILDDAYLRNDEMQNPEKYEIMSKLGSPASSFSRRDERTSVSSIPVMQNSSDLLSISDDES